MPCSNWDATGRRPAADGHLWAVLRRRASSRPGDGSKGWVGASKKDGTGRPHQGFTGVEDLHAVNQAGTRTGAVGVGVDGDDRLGVGRLRSPQQGPSNGGSAPSKTSACGSSCTTPSTLGTIAVGGRAVVTASGQSPTGQREVQDSGWQQAGTAAGGDAQSLSRRETLGDPTRRSKGRSDEGPDAGSARILRSCSTATTSQVVDA
jgi:hypothetical protein